jgi:hypothetical protein
MEPKRPAVTCKSCARTWNSAAMAEGLQLLGACPRCGGELEFDDRARRVTRDQPADAASAPAGDPATPEVAPHLVLGIPRR